MWQNKTWEEADEANKAVRQTRQTEAMQEEDKQWSIREEDSGGECR
jgi:hypothetical protein